MNAPSPYQLEQAMSVLLSARERLLTEDPDIADDEKLFADMLEGESGNAMAVLHHMLRAAVMAESMEDAARVMASDIAARAARFAARKNAFRGAAFAAMDALALKKIELPNLTASIRTGPQSVVITNADAVPDAFARIERKPDKTLIVAALKAGNAVPGAELGNGLNSLSIRTK